MGGFLHAKPQEKTPGVSDLQDNMDISRIPAPTEKDLARLEKYKLAKVRIEKAMKG